jgi:hypothetical protein
MGMLSNIFNKIFNRDTPAEAAPAPAGSPAATPAPSAGAATPAPAAMQEVDVEALLNSKAEARAEKLNWLKLLDLDSSMAARKELAQELHFSGDTNDSASMNIWLHRQVMNKLAANGGKVPADLKD